MENKEMNSINILLNARLNRREYCYVRAFSNIEELEPRLSLNIMKMLERDNLLMIREFLQTNINNDRWLPL